MKETIYLIIAREKAYALNFLDSFISKHDYSENEKIAYHKDIGKIELSSCIFRFCYYEGTVIHEKSPEKD